MTRVYLTGPLIGAIAAELLPSATADLSLLWGMERLEEAAALVETLPVPLLTSQHLSLPDGRSFEGETEFEIFWASQESEFLGEDKSTITE